jgi:Protein of unknown function (DUF3617)
MRIAALGIAIIVASAGAPARAAAPNAKPGLWERTVTRQMEGAPVAPMADSAKLTPEQRARLEQMMSLRGTTAPTTSIVRYCITPEAAQRWESFAQDSGADTKCERTVQDESAGALKMTLVCAGGQQGTAAFTAVDANRIRGTITWVRQESAGERKTTVAIDSRWVSADCGAVKPGAPQQVKG